MPGQRRTGAAATSQKHDDEAGHGEEQGAAPSPARETRAGTRKRVLPEGDDSIPTSPAARAKHAPAEEEQAGRGGVSQDDLPSPKPADGDTPSPSPTQRALGSPRAALIIPGLMQLHVQVAAALRAPVGEKELRALKERVGSKSPEGWPPYINKDKDSGLLRIRFSVHRQQVWQLTDPVFTTFYGRIRAQHRDVGLDTLHMYTQQLQQLLESMEPTVDNAWRFVAVFVRTPLGRLVIGRKQGKTLPVLREWAEKESE